MRIKHSNFLRGLRENLGFKWWLGAFSLLIAGVIATFGFISGSFMSAYTTHGMNQTYALVVEANVPPPSSMDAMTPAMRFRWKRNATLLNFTAGGAQRSAMVSTLPYSMEGMQVLIWYNAETFGNVMLDEERPFQVPPNMLPVGAICLAIGIWMIWYDRHLKSGRHTPVARPGVGGGRHKGRF